MASRMPVIIRRARGAVADRTDHVRCAARPGPCPPRACGRGPGAACPRWCARRSGSPGSPAPRRRRAREMAQRHHQHFVDEQADDDRRRRQQDVVDEADHGRQLLVPAVFGQLGAGENADRRADQHGDQAHQADPTMALRNPPPAHRRRRRLGQQRWPEDRQALRTTRCPRISASTASAGQGGGSGQRHRSPHCAARRAGHAARTDCHGPISPIRAAQPRQHHLRRRQHQEGDARTAPGPGRSATRCRSASSPR